MKYADFTIQVVAQHPQGFAVNVIESPAGEGSAQFDLPFSQEELSRVLAEIRAPTEVPTRGPRPTPLRDVRINLTASPDRIGQKLFDALFRGEVLSLFERSLGRLELDSSTGLRVKILIDPRNPHLSFLQTFPWELLYSARDRDYIALNRKRPIVRYLMVPHRSALPPFKPPLRILVVAANISDPSLPRLDLDGESRNLQEAMSRDPRVELIKPESPTILGIRKALLKTTCHAIHFMGHGTFDQNATEGVLLFQGSDGTPERVSGVALAQVLRDFPSLRLMVLNACNSAFSGKDAHPFAGVANALVLSGLPAVVAMQFPITDWDAIEFSKAFYTRLVENDPIDAAVAEGRQAVHARDDRCVDWSAPALFMRSPDGQIFAPSDTPPEPAPIRKKRSKAFLGLALLILTSLMLALAFPCSHTPEQPPSEPSTTSDTTTDAPTPSTGSDQDHAPSDPSGQPPAVESPSAEAQSQSTVTIVNNSRWAVQHIYISPTSDRSWGNDVLGNDILRPGQQTQIYNILCDSYGIKLVDEDRYVCVLEQINLCGSSRQWVITDDTLVQCERSTP
ncbi:MAG TPA: CHAT domain-containing protein [Thermoanaerobaculia bacterium]|nr:CHAT domain-containing protein [Thermoanaerobaculia bacterium]